MKLVTYVLGGGGHREAQAQVLYKKGKQQYLITSFPKELTEETTAQTEDGTPLSVLLSDRDEDLVLLSSESGAIPAKLLRTKNKKLKRFLSKGDYQRLGFCFRNTVKQFGVVVDFIFAKSTLPQVFLGRLLVAVADTKHSKAEGVTGKGNVRNEKLLSWLEARDSVVLYFAGDDFTMSSSLDSVVVHRSDCTSGALRKRRNGAAQKAVVDGATFIEFHSGLRRKYPQLFLQPKHQLEKDMLVVESASSAPDLALPQLVDTINGAPCTSLSALPDGDMNVLFVGGGELSLSAQLHDLPLHLTTNAEGVVEGLERQGGILALSGGGVGSSIPAKKLKNGEKVRGGGIIYKIGKLISVNPGS